MIRKEYRFIQVCSLFRPNFGYIPGRYQSGQLGQTVNLLADAFGGSNPPLPTVLLFAGLPAGRPANKNAGVAQLAEHNPSKVRAAGSSPVSRSGEEADVAQW